MSKISRTKAVELIKNSDGTVFKVGFTKNNEEPRTIVGTFKEEDLTNLGYLTVSSIEDAGIRSVNTRTINYLKMDGIEYTIN